MEAHVRLRFKDRRELVDHLQYGVGEIVGRVRSVPADAGKGYELSVAGGDAIVAGPYHGVVGVVALDPEAPEDLLAEFPVHTPGKGAFPVGEKVLVDPSEGDAGTGIVLVAHDEHVGEPQGLYRLPEGGRGLPGHAVEIFRHLA